MEEANRAVPSRFSLARHCFISRTCQYRTRDTAGAIPTLLDAPLQSGIHQAHHDFGTDLNTVDCIEPSTLDLSLPQVDSIVVVAAKTGAGRLEAFRKGLELGCKQLESVGHAAN